MSSVSRASGALPRSYEPLRRPVRVELRNQGAPTRWAHHCQPTPVVVTAPVYPQEGASLRNERGSNSIRTSQGQEGNENSSSSSHLSGANITNYGWLLVQGDRGHVSRTGGEYGEPLPRVSLRQRRDHHWRGPRVRRVRAADQLLRGRGGFGNSLLQTFAEEGQGYQAEGGQKRKLRSASAASTMVCSEPSGSGRSRQLAAEPELGTGGRKRSRRGRREAARARAEQGLSPTSGNQAEESTSGVCCSCHREQQRGVVDFDDDYVERLAQALASKLEIEVKINEGKDGFACKGSAGDLFVVKRTTNSGKGKKQRLRRRKVQKSEGSDHSAEGSLVHPASGRRTKSESSTETTTSTEESDSDCGIKSPTASYLPPGGRGQGLYRVLCAECKSGYCRDTVYVSGGDSSRELQSDSDRFASPCRIRPHYYCGKRCDGVESRPLSRSKQRPQGNDPAGPDYVDSDWDAELAREAAAAAAAAEPAEVRPPEFNDSDLDTTRASETDPPPESSQVPTTVRVNRITSRFTSDSDSEDAEISQLFRLRCFGRGRGRRQDFGDRGPNGSKS